MFILLYTGCYDPEAVEKQTTERLSSLYYIIVYVIVTHSAFHTL